MNNRESGKRMAAAILVLALGFPTAAYGAGWERMDKEQWRYVNDDGSYIRDGFSPDGYYVDGSGIWQADRVFLGAKVPNRNTFLTSSQVGSLMNLEASMKTMMQAVGEECGDVRGITLEEKQVICFTLKSREEEELFSFYKEEETDGYVLRLKCALSSSKGTNAKLSWYDYQVIRAILCGVCPAGTLVGDAIYSSWEDDNRWGLKSGTWVLAGGVMIKYEAASGAGIYHIKAAQTMP